MEANEVSFMLLKGKENQGGNVSFKMDIINHGLFKYCSILNWVHSITDFIKLIVRIFFLIKFKFQIRVNITKR